MRVCAFSPYAFDFGFSFFVWKYMLHANELSYLKFRVFVPIHFHRFKCFGIFFFIFVAFHKGGICASDTGVLSMFEISTRQT